MGHLPRLRLLEQQLGGGWKGKVSAEYQEADSRLRYAGSFGAIDPQTGDGGQLTGAAYKFKSIQRSPTPTSMGRCDCSA